MNRVKNENEGEAWEFEKKVVQQAALGPTKILRRNLGTSDKLFIEEENPTRRLRF